MRSDTDHREQLDDFSEFMKRKLEDHRLPVDDFCWEEIEPRMKPRRQTWLWWAGSSVAAAVIAILFLFSPFRAGEAPDGGPELPVAVTYDEEEVHPATPQDDTEKTVLPVERPVPAKKLIAAVIPAKSSQMQEKEIPEVSEGTEDMVNAADVVNTEEPEKTVQPAEDRKKAASLDLYSYKSEKHAYSSAGKNKKVAGKWSVNAGFGTGGHVSLGLGTDYDMVQDPSNNVSDGGIIYSSPARPAALNASGVLSPSEYSNVDVALPLSFGLTIRRDFNRYIGLETGLVYTYLASNLSKWDEVQYKSHLELHYLGIPVNLVVSLWQNSRWKIYLTGGVMMEKGLRAKQTESRFWQMEMNNLVDKRGISGLQWSLNASAGVSYRFYKDWNFYFEPRISHYFDNDQPVSIRTEHSVIVGLGAGVRFDF